MSAVNLGDSTLPSTLPHTIDAATQESREIIALLVNDEVLEQNIAHQLEQFGYTVAVARNANRLEEIHSKGNVTAIVISYDLPETKAPALLQRLRTNDTNTPSFVITSDTSIQAHVESVAAGAELFLSLPLDTSALIDGINRLACQHQREPFKILIIDDTESVAQYYSLVLQKVGMRTEILTNPYEIQKPLAEFNPDLILLDLYMPEVSGSLLAKVIRQQDRYCGIPIVFLSSEENIDTQLHAMTLGADDFINKTISAKRLVNTISSRVYRARKLRSLMSQDSLTGLYNHSTTKERMAGELQRSQRTCSPLSFAMIDIDHFKRVNDTYGHLAGDRVIRQLAYLLKQRLRRTDIIGRLGGEEFGVIMPDTHIEAAHNAIEKLRLSFSQITHPIDSKQFSCTFSCGISGYPDHKTLEQLQLAADERLYKAKNGGRNQIVV